MSAYVRLDPAARWPVPLEAGSTFAGFRIVRRSVKGMGEVYLVEHPQPPREEALKVLPENVTSDDEYRQRFVSARPNWHRPCGT